MAAPSAATRRFYSAFYQWNQLGATVSRVTPHGRHAGRRRASSAAMQSDPEQISSPRTWRKEDVKIKARFYMDATALAAFRTHKAEAFQNLMYKHGCQMSRNQMDAEKRASRHSAMSVLVSGNPSSLDSALDSLRYQAKEWCESLAIPSTNIYRLAHNLTDAELNDHVQHASMMEAPSAASSAKSAPARLSNPWATEGRVASGSGMGARLHIGQAALEAFRAHKAEAFLALVRSTGCLIYRRQMLKGGPKQQNNGIVFLYGSLKALQKARRAVQHNTDKWCEDLGIPQVSVRLYDKASGLDIEDEGFSVHSEDAASMAPGSTVPQQSTTTLGRAIPSPGYQLSDTSSATVDLSQSQTQAFDTSSVERAREAPAASLITGNPFRSQGKPTDSFTAPSTTTSSSYHSQEGPVRRICSEPVPDQTSTASTVHGTPPKDHEWPASSALSSKASELQSDKDITSTSGQARKPPTTLRVESSRARNKTLNTSTTTSSTERHYLIIPTTFIPHLSLNESSALKSAKLSSGCIDLKWILRGGRPLPEALIQAVGTPDSIAHAQNSLQRIITQACLDKGIEEVKITSVNEATFEKQLSDNMRVVLRTLTNPAVVLTTYGGIPPSNAIPSAGTTNDNLTNGTSNTSATSPSSESMSDYHGVTVSSITPVTLSPQPIISFNLAADSRTFTALEKTGELNLHILAATPLGAKIADTFAKPYDSPAIPFQRLVDTGNVAVYQTRGPAGVGPWSPVLSGRGVVARLHAVTSSVGSRAPHGMTDIEVPPSVRVGNKVVVFAQVVAVSPGSRKRGLKNLQALAYSGGAYRGLGGAIVPGDKSVWAVKEAETVHESVREVERSQIVDGGGMSSSQMDTTDFFDALSGELEIGDDNAQIHRDGKTERSKSQESEVEVKSAEDLEGVWTTASGSETLQTHASETEAQNESYSDGLTASSLEDLDDVLGEEYDQLPGYEDQASAFEVGQQLESIPGQVPEEAALAMDKECADNDIEVNEADEVEAAAALRNTHDETPKSSDEEIGQPSSTAQIRTGNNTAEVRFERASMPSAPSFFGTKTMPPSRHGGGNMSTANVGLPTSRYFSTSPRPLASSNDQPAPETLQQTVAEFFGPTSVSKRQPRTRHMLTSRRIISETYAQLAALQDLETQQEQTPEQQQQMPGIFESEILSPEERLAARTAFLERKIEHHTRRLNRSLAKFSSRDLRDMLDTGHVDHRLIAYMESQVEKGLQIAKSDAERARLALANGELDQKGFEQVKERILMDYEVLAAELGRLRQVLEEELEDFRDEDD